jgi:serine/threonine protein kinase
VDEAWNVKVADFGFARIKEENATMTRCGTPCWTAPEIIRGESYSEKADVYSFGIVMWELLTRKVPYASQTFMSVALEVLDGKRPEVPSDCPPDFKELMQRCWHKARHLHARTHAHARTMHLARAHSCPRSTEAEQEAHHGGGHGQPRDPDHGRAVLRRQRVNNNR